MTSKYVDLHSNILWIQDWCRWGKFLTNCNNRMFFQIEFQRVNGKKHQSTITQLSDVILRKIIIIRIVFFSLINVSQVDLCFVAYCCSKPIIIQHPAIHYLPSPCYWPTSHFIHYPPSPCSYPTSHYLLSLELWH